MSEPYSLEVYSDDVLKAALIAGSHEANGVVAQGAHLRYLDTYLRQIGARSIVVERRYVDRDFLEDFASYHVRCFAPYIHECQRLHFFSKEITRDIFESALTDEDAATELRKNYLGFIVIKPLPQTVIGRTCLATYPLTVDSRVRHFPTLRTESANLFGIELPIASLPFQEQDMDVAACASSALWTALNGTGRLFQHATPSPVEITKAAGVHLRAFNRHFPAGGGLTPHQMADAIRGVGLEPHALAAGASWILKVSARAYMEAGIPCVLLGQLCRGAPPPAGQKLDKATVLGGHAVAMVGYGAPASAGTSTTPHGCRIKALDIDRFYCHDDQLGPFAKFSCLDNRLILDVPPSDEQRYFIPEIIMAPLYHKIRVSVEDIIKYTIQLDEIVEVLRISGLIGVNERITWDIKLTTVNKMRSAISKSALDITSKRQLLMSHFPRFLWKMEASVYGAPIFDILLDATDLIQGDHLVDVIPYDRNVVKLISHAQPHIAGILSQYPRLARLFDWFSRKSTAIP